MACRKQIQCWKNDVLPQNDATWEWIHPATSTFETNELVVITASGFRERNLCCCENLASIHCFQLLHCCSGFISWLGNICKKSVPCSRYSSCPRFFLFSHRDLFQDIPASRRRRPSSTSGQLYHKGYACSYGSSHFRRWSGLPSCGKAVQTWSSWACPGSEAFPGHNQAYWKMIRVPSFLGSSWAGVWAYCEQLLSKYKFLKVCCSLLQNSEYFKLFLTMSAQNRMFLDHSVADQIFF